MGDTVLVTGGAGFIGSHFVRAALKRGVKVINLDLLTYASDVDTIQDILNNPEHNFVKGDIKDWKTVEPLVRKADYIVHFAAETHVDRSIIEGGDFALTNFYGTYVLLEAARRAGNLRKFIYISTDEIYGPIKEGSFREGDPMNPSSPYSASKAGADRLAFSFYKTYGMPVVIVRPSNNFGPYQHPEKAVPLFITNLFEGEKIPLYGSGENMREWLFVEDCVEGIWRVLEKGKEGEAYNLSSGFRLKNIDLIRLLLNKMGKPFSMVEFVQDRPGHDLRYSIDSEKLHSLGWVPQHTFEDALEVTIDWYKNHQNWWEKRKEAKEFKEYYSKNYKRRKK